MTILCRIKRQGFDLRVCGTPSKDWLDWLKTAEVPLTEGQKFWLDVGGTPVKPAPRRPGNRRPAPQFDLVDTEEL